MKNIGKIEETVKRLNPEGFAWVMDALPTTPPPYWKVLRYGEDGYACMHRITGMTLIASGSRQSDGRKWLHVSIGYHNRLPSYQELADAKRDFLGDDLYAYQVFAPRKEHVNIHNYVLHLWCCLDEPEGRVLPDLTEGTGSI